MGAENEQQIDEIMNELEELKKEVSGTDSDSDTAEPVSELDEFRAAGGEASMEDTLSDLKDEAPPSGKSLLDADVVDAEDSPEEEAVEEVEEEVAEEVEAKTETPDDDYDADELEQELEKELAGKEAKVIPYRNNQSTEDGALTLTLKGDINLKLRYESGGQDVCVSFSEGYLHVELADGSEFKIPVGSNKRKAA